MSHKCPLIAPQDTTEYTLGELAFSRLRGAEAERSFHQNGPEGEVDPVAGNKLFVQIAGRSPGLFGEDPSRYSCFRFEPEG